MGGVSRAPSEEWEGLAPSGEWERLLGGFGKFKVRQICGTDLILYQT